MILSTSAAAPTGYFAAKSVEFKGPNAYNIGLGTTLGLNSGSYKVVARLKYNFYASQSGDVGDVWVRVKKNGRSVFEQTKALVDKHGNAKSAVADVELGTLELQERSHLELSFRFKNSKSGWATKAWVQFRSPIGE